MSRQREAIVITGPTRRDWEPREISEDLSTLKELVGGSIELVDLGKGLRGYVNDDGRATLPPFAIWKEGLRRGVVPGTEAIHGPLVIVGGRYRHAAIALVEQVLDPYTRSEG